MKHLFKTILLCLLALSMLPCAALSAAEDGNSAIAVARTLVDVFDPCFGMDFQDAYLYRAEQTGNEWRVTVSIPGDFTFDGSNMVDFYVLTISSTGELLNTTVDPDNIALTPGQNEFLALRRLTAERGPWYDWTIEQRIDFEKNYRDGSYRLPGEGDLPQEEALAIGYKALQEATGKTDAEMDALYGVANLNTETAHWADQWTVLFYEPNQPRTGYGTAYPNQVQISNPTGDVLQIFISGEGNG